MKNIKKYEGIIPALYACYDENGAVSIERTKALTQWFIDQGVNGLYVGGSSGECIYQTKEERKAAREKITDAFFEKITEYTKVASNRVYMQLTAMDPQDIWRYVPKAQFNIFTNPMQIYYNKQISHKLDIMVSWRSKNE